MLGAYITRETGNPILSLFKKQSIQLLPTGKERQEVPSKYYIYVGMAAQFRDEQTTETHLISKK